MPDYTLADDLSLALALPQSRPRSFNRHSPSIVVDHQAGSHARDGCRPGRRGLIRERIEAARPHDTILGEEYGGGREDGRQWIIDPIDGTAIYATFRSGTLIALAIDGVPVVGVVSSPAARKRWWRPKVTAPVGNDLTRGDEARAGETDRKRHSRPGGGVTQL